MNIKPYKTRIKIKRKEHKGENGRLMVVGGSEDYVGAPALAALAALQTGVDIVVVCAPEKVAWTINSYSPDLITKKFFGKEFDVTHCKEIIKMSENFDCVLIGNGLGIKKDFVNKIVKSINVPMVLDADALKVINAGLIENCILTPHSKEFQILFENCLMGKEKYDPDYLEENIKNFRKTMAKNVILLKGKEDIIFTKHRITVNKTGHNSMTVGGTGDILAGLCAGYVAQSGNLFEAAKEAAYVNGRTGEALFKQKGYSYTSYDFVSELWKQIK